MCVLDRSGKEKQQCHLIRPPRSNQGRSSHFWLEEWAVYVWCVLHLLSCISQGSYRQAHSRISQAHAGATGKALNYLTVAFRGMCLEGFGLHCIVLAQSILFLAMPSPIPKYVGAWATLQRTLPGSLVLRVPNLTTMDAHAHALHAVFFG